MTVQIEVIFPEGQTATQSFELAPRTGEWLDIQGHPPMIISHVVHSPWRDDYQTRIYTQYAPVNFSG